VKEGGKEVVPPVTLKHCSNFYYEGSKAYEGRYSVPSKVPSKVFGGRKLFLPGHFGFIFDGRVETCFYCEVSCGPLLGCVIGGVTESHRHSAAIATGAERRGFVTNRGRDWSVATPIPDR
jgi:hypothetical protein